MYFPKGGSKLTKEGNASMDRIGELLKSNPEATLTLEGYAAQGESEDNQKLAEDRARNAMNVLLKKFKILATRLDLKGKVEGTDPRNQKVEFLFASTKKEVS
jgi:outer membrane protein OmpA-like peptidoglycan-associated protein